MKQSFLEYFGWQVCALSVNCMTVKPQCPNCTAQHIKTINATTGRCVDCWPCPVCNEGSGSSVPCEAVVTVHRKIHCVFCVPGTNFSDSTGIDQCQPCGMCSGKHESVHSECTRENNVVCKCDLGFFRNKTTQECLPCASCCSGDHNILEHCQRDGDEIKKKCKFEEPWPSICLPSLTAVGTINSISVSHTYLSSLATSSSLMSFSYKHSTATPVLGTVTKIAPAPSETVYIKVTSASFPRPNRHTKISGISTVNKDSARKESPDINIVIPLPKTAVVLISVVVSLLATAGCVTCLYCTYRSWQARNNPHALEMTFNESEARDNEERKSSEYSGAAQPLIELTELPLEATTSPSSRTDEGIRLLPDIPTSLENEPQNLGKYHCTYLSTIISRLFIIRICIELKTFTVFLSRYGCKWMPWEHNLQGDVFSRMTWSQISLISNNAIFNETILLKLYHKKALYQHILNPFSDQKNNKMSEMSHCNPEG